MDLDFEKLWLNIGKISLIVIVGAMVLFVSDSPDRSQGECYTKVEKCQGVDLMGCVGQEKTELDFVPKNKCDAVQNITKECKTLKRAICNTEEIEDRGWMEKAETSGRSCGRWIREYDLNISKSC